jgi:hypothetical protein
MYGQARWNQTRTFAYISKSDQFWDQFRGAGSGIRIPLVSGFPWCVFRCVATDRQVIQRLFLQQYYSYSSIAILESLSLSSHAQLPPPRRSSYALYPRNWFTASAILWLYPPITTIILRHKSFYYYR